MCWECEVKGSLTASRLASGGNWFPRVQPAFGSKLQLLSQSVLRVWHGSGYEWSTKTTNALTQRQLGDVRDICFTETRAAGTLAPRESCRVHVKLPGTPGATSCHHKADLHAPTLLQCTLRILDEMEKNCSANSLYMGDFKEHLITCSYVSRFWHLSILLS